ncbi:MAG: polyprenyl synthetase family protein [Microgenomates group bacterium]
MDLIKKINFYRNLFLPKINLELNNYSSIFYDYSSEKKEIIDLLKKLVIKGKGIRGSLVYIINEILNLKIKEKNLFYLAAFFEIIHSSLLIHDDIMDNDTSRRGGKTIHFYYQEKFKEIKTDDLVGKNFAINIGDIGFFIGFDFFNKVKLEKNKKSQLLSFIIKEYIQVALAQIDDVFFSQTKNEPKIDEILKIYLYKTARYTFALPILTVIFIKDHQYFGNKNFLSILEKLGIIFQISDDLIGFLSDETGKDLGSDIRENKKTLIRYFLTKELKNNQLKNLFGKKNIDKNEIKKLRDFFEVSKTKRKINKIINHYRNEIIIDLKKNNYPQKFKNLILEFIEYLISRKK